MKKIFFPSKITDLTYSKPSYWLNDKKLGLLIIYLLIFVFVTFTVMKYENKPLTIGVAVVQILIFQWIIRKTVLEEDRLYNLIIDYLKGVVMKADDIINVKMVESDGKIILGNGRYGYLVRLNRGLILNRPADFDDIHKDFISKFLRYITRAEASSVIINMSKTSYYNEGLEQQKKLLKEIDPALGADFANMQRVILSDLSKHNRAASSIEVDYVFIYSSSPNLMFDLRTVIENGLKELEGSLYHSTQIYEDLEEIKKFYLEEYGVSILTLKNRIKSTADKFLADAFMIITKYQDGYPVFEDEVIEEE